MLQSQPFYTLLERVQSAAAQANEEGVVCAPVHDPTVFRALLQEAEHMAMQQDEQDLVVLLDSDTLMRLASYHSVLSRAQRFIVMGNDTDRGLCPENIEFVVTALPTQPSDRFLLFVSSSMSLALFSYETNSPLQSRYRGGWTVQRSTVLHLAEALLGKPLSEASPELSSSQINIDRISSAAMRLTALHANALESREQDINAQKSDLLSVLEILKAISAKRSAHDILYVFVEQIAQIIEMKRCSIVRVFNGDPCGHVLASHEDSDISDHVIDLRKYPELKASVDSGRKIVINDVHRDPLTSEYSMLFQRAAIDALLVLPIVLRDPNIGTLLLRSARQGSSFSIREISFLEIVAEAAANALEKAQLFDSIQRANERLERLAITDALTGIYNRRYFFDRFQQEFDRALRYRLPLSCVLLDVDDFKAINDKHGHIAGDSVLRELSQRVQSCIRRVDILARYGGEELVILLPQTSSEGAQTEAERIRENIASKFFTAIPQGPAVTVSIGVSVLYPETMKTSEDLLRAADEALYRAKQAGKNRVVMS